jgi:hypothetical protein
MRSARPMSRSQSRRAPGDEYLLAHGDFEHDLATAATDDEISAAKERFERRIAPLRCIVCGENGSVISLERCRSCYDFFHLKGRDRTERERQALAQRRAARAGSRYEALAREWEIAALVGLARSSLTAEPPSA